MVDPFAGVDLARLQREHAQLRIGAAPVESFADSRWAFFAVYDGHSGSRCSEFLQERLHLHIADRAANASSSRRGSGDRGGGSRER